MLGIRFALTSASFESLPSKKRTFVLRANIYIFFPTEGSEKNGSLNNRVFSELESRGLGIVRKHLLNIKRPNTVLWHDLLYDQR